MIDHPKLEAETLGLLREHVEGMFAQARSEFVLALKAAMVRKRRGRRRRRQTYRMGPPDGNVTPAVQRGYLSMLARRSNLRSLRNMTHWRRRTGAWEGIR